MQNKKYYLSSFYRNRVNPSVLNQFFPQVTFYIPRNYQQKKIRIIIDSGILCIQSLETHISSHLYQLHFIISLIYTFQVRTLTSEKFPDTEQVKYSQHEI